MWRMSTPGRDEPAPATYVARFPRLQPALMIAFGVLLPARVFWAALTDRSAANLVYALLGLLVLGTLPWLGLTRLRQGAKNGWVALSAGPDGVSFARESGGPVHFRWEEIDAFVLFSRRTGSARGVVRCVGVRLRPADSEVAGEPPRAAGTAVDFHTEARGWGFTRTRLKEAVHTYAPDVRVAEHPSTDYESLVGSGDAGSRS